jgi:leucyl-tRNA synthetase
MSKSKYNGVDPTAIVAQYGADTARVFTLFKAPPQAVLVWDDDSIQGVHRWLHRVWTLVEAHADAVDQDGRGAESPADHEIARATNLTIMSVTRAFDDTHSFNTAVSDLMKLSNTLKDTATTSPATTHAMRALLVLLSPAAPHFAAELWQRLEGLPAGDPMWFPHRPIHEQQWPKADESKLHASLVDLPIQINGKFRGAVSVPTEALDGPEAELRALVMESELGQKWIPNADRVAKVILPKSKKMIGFLLKKQDS